MHSHSTAPQNIHWKFPGRAQIIKNARDWNSKQFSIRSAPFSRTSGSANWKSHGTSVSPETTSTVSKILRPFIFVWGSLSWGLCMKLIGRSLVFVVDTMNKTKTMYYSFDGFQKDKVKTTAFNWLLLKKYRLSFLKKTWKSFISSNKSQFNRESTDKLNRCLIFTSCRHTLKRIRRSATIFVAPLRERSAATLFVATRYRECNKNCIYIYGCRKWRFEVTLSH